MATSNPGGLTELRRAQLAALLGQREQAVELLRSSTNAAVGGISLARAAGMLKLVGSYVIAKLLGFGLLGAIVIYLLLSMFT